MRCALLKRLEPAWTPGRRDIQPRTRIRGAVRSAAVAPCPQAEKGCIVMLDQEKAYDRFSPLCTASRSANAAMISLGRRGAR